MIRTYISLPLLILTLSACTTTYYARRDWSDEAARSEAQRDIKSGRIKILCAGGAQPGPLGISPDDRHLIKEIPEVWFFKNDFFDHKARYYSYPEEAKRFGSNYNAMILEFLKPKADASR
jgi:hypothetical protein